MKLLALRLDAAGDVLMCTPALHALSSHGHRVSLLTSASGALAGECVDAIENVDGGDGDGRGDGVSRKRAILRFDAPWMKASAPVAPQAVAEMAAVLKLHRFDGAVIFTSHTQSPLPAALLCQMAGIPLRLAHCRENPYQLLTHWVRDPEPALLRHEVQRQLDLVATLGCHTSERHLRLQVSDKDRAAAGALLSEAGLAEGQRFILLHPGASAPSRRYPARHWHALVRMLPTRLARPLVIAGGADDQALAAALCVTEPRCINVAGKTSFGMLAALVARASVLIACNSAPAHIAAALRTPVVDLYALTNLQHMPWLVDCRVLFQPVPCAGCLQSTCPQPHHACLEQVSPERVLQAVHELLAHR